MDSLPVLAPARSSYPDIQRSNGLYIDKTPWLPQLLTPASPDSATDLLRTPYVFLSRPRRFGKTLLVSLLECWFQGLPDEEDAWPDWLFAGTAVKLEWREKAGSLRPVVRLDMSRVVADTPAQLQARLRRQLLAVSTPWVRRGLELPGVSTHGAGKRQTVTQLPSGHTSDSWLEQLLDSLHIHYGAKPVVLIDEYDAPITHLLGNRASLPHNDSILAGLREFYRVLKSDEHNLHFTFITGISRFARVNLFSALNNLEDISWHDTCAALCGFTENEVTTYLVPYMEHIAQPHGISPAAVRQSLRDYYNGYRFYRLQRLSLLSV